ncbi:MAG: hypothetical protein NTU83_01755, partial [Candidatus Hydrogenedentes bacterium]|nr:hypothetical protein [Candidatus Hydrogenedentota bacterium]
TRHATKSDLLPLACLVLLVAMFFAALCANAGEQRVTDGILTVVHDPADAPVARETLDTLKEELAECAPHLPVGGAPITVYLCHSMQEFKTRAGAYGQARIGGVAKAEKGVIIVRAPAILSSPADFRGTVRHELIHVLLARNTEPAYVPRWFDEGVAMVLSKELRWESAIEVARMYVQRRLSPYRELDFAFAPIGDETTFSGAYAQALSMTQWLMHRMGADRFWQLVAGLRTMPFEDALRTYAKLTPAGLDDGWRTSLWKVALIASLVSGFSAFQLMAVLVVVAYLYKRRRGQRLMRQWDEEDDGEPPVFHWESIEEGPYSWEEEDDDERKW